MGFFKRRQSEHVAPMPLGPPPTPKTCVCGVTLSADKFPGHVDTHIVAVTTSAGHPGVSFDCPLCGPSDSAYGQPGEHPNSLEVMSRAFFRKHCRDAHGVNL